MDLIDNLRVIPLSKFIETNISLEVKTKEGDIYLQRNLDLIKHFEGIHDGDPKEGLQPQMDPIGIWTVGYGHALTDKNGTFLRGLRDKDKAYNHPLGNLNLKEAQELLDMDLKRIYIPEVLKMIKRPLKTQELGALTSFTYNCGTHYLNNGKRVPYRIWENVNSGMTGKALFDYWKSSVIKANGITLQGLVTRRKSECWYYLYGTLNFNPPNSI